MVISPKEEQVLFHYELGKSIAQWASVEHSLGYLAAACFPQSSYSVAIAGYFGIENFRSKLEFADRMVQQVTEGRPELLQRWDALAVRIKSGSELRNKLAHWSFTNYPEGPVGRRVALTKWIEVLQGDSLLPKHERKRQGPALAPPEAICALQLGEAQVQFRELWITLENFRHLLVGHPTPFEEDFEQGLSRPTFAVLDTHFRADVGLPLRPSRRSRPAPGDEAAEQERQKMRDKLGPA